MSGPYYPNNGDQGQVDGPIRQEHFAPRLKGQRLLIFGGGGLGLALALIGYGLTDLGVSSAALGLSFLILGGLILIGVAADAVVQLTRHASTRAGPQDDTDHVGPPRLEVTQVGDVVRLVVTHPAEALTAGDYEAEVVDLTEVETLLEPPLPWHVRWRGSSGPRLQILPGHEAVLEIVTLRQDAAQQMLWGHRREAAYLFHSPGEELPVDAPLGAKDWADIGSPLVAVRLSRVAPHFTSVIGVRCGFRSGAYLETIPEDGLEGSARGQIRRDQERDRMAQQSKARLYGVVRERFGHLVATTDELDILARAAQWVIDAPQVYGEYTYPILDDDGTLTLRFREDLKGVGIRADGGRETLEQIATLHRHLVSEARAWDWGRDGTRTEQRALMREIQRRQVDL
jgi:hypothetical protein